MNIYDSTVDELEIARLRDEINKIRDAKTPEQQNKEKISYLRWMLGLSSPDPEVRKKAGDDRMEEIRQKRIKREEMPK